MNGWADDLATAGRLVRLGGPIAIGRLGVVGMGVVDTIAVGQLAPRELAYQVLGWTINGPALIGGIGLLLGVQVLAARALGAGATGGLALVWRRGMVLALAAGALICLGCWVCARPLLETLGVAPALARRGAGVGAVLALSVPLHLGYMASAKFFEALERPGPPAAATWAANVLNLILNLALVPAWGAVGSAWATVASRLFLAAGLPLWMWASPPLRTLLAGGWMLAWRPRWRELLLIGAAAGLSGLVEAAAFSAMAVIAARAGGAVAVSVFNIATGSLVTLAYLLAQGLATAALVLTAEAVGAQAAVAARRIGWLALALTLGAMAVCGGGVTLFAGPVARAFTADAPTAAALAAAMGYVALLMLPDGGQGPVDGALRALGDNWLPTAVRFGAFVGLAPALALWLTTVMSRPAEAVLAATVIASALALLVLCLRLGTLATPRPSA